MIMDPHPSQQRAGLHHTVFQLQKEVTRPEPTLLKKYEVDGGGESGTNISSNLQLNGYSYMCDNHDK